MPARKPQGGDGDAGRTRRRRYTASEKIAFLSAYDDIAERAAKTRFLTDNGLSASLISQWRRQVYEAAREALAAEPGGQPARKIHLSKAVWNDLTALGAALDPPMSPERYVRALCSWATGRDRRIPGRDAPARPAAPAQPAGGEEPRRDVHVPPVVTGYIEQILAGSVRDGAIGAGEIPALARTLTGVIARARKDQRAKDLGRMTKGDLVLMCNAGVWTPDGKRVKVGDLDDGDPVQSWEKDRIIEAILDTEFRPAGS